MTRAYLCACVLLAAPASAQELAGPQVQPTTLPGASETFGGEPDRMDLAARVPMEVFVRALRSLQADEATRISDAQRDAIREAMDGFRRAAALFEREHRGELRRLRRQAADMDDPDREVDQGRMDELRDRGEAMRRAAPDPGDAQRKIWAELTEAQRAAVEAEIDTWRAEQDERAVGRLTRRFEAEIGEPLGPAGDPRQRLEAIGGPVTDEVLADLPLPERARQRLARLTPEQRARVLRRFARGEVPRRDRGGRRVAPPEQGRSPAEPPPMERVPLPEPDGA